jgi:hypothetical protein
MNAPATCVSHDVVKGEVEDASSGSCAAVDMPDRRRSPLELRGETELVQDALAERLENDPCADATRFGDALEHLDGMAVACQEESRRRARGSAADDRDSHPLRNVLVMSITISRSRLVVTPHIRRTFLRRAGRPFRRFEANPSGR